MSQMLVKCFTGVLAKKYDIRVYNNYVFWKKARYMYYLYGVQRVDLYRYKLNELNGIRNIKRILPIQRTV